MFAYLRSFLFVYICVLRILPLVLQTDESDDGKCTPEIGCLVNGLFLDGAAWCRFKNHLVDPKNGILLDEMVTVSIQYIAVLLLAL